MTPLPPPLDQLEPWLAQALPSGTAEGALLDVGAFHGDFTAAMLAAGVCREAWLFEPNPDSQAVLRPRFAATKGVTLVPTAVGAAVGPRELKRDGHPSTASLLDYADQAAATRADRVTVACTTLDAWWEQQGSPKIRLLKVDTQGHDLAVLAGAERLVARDRPHLVVELIFTPLYQGQCSPAALLTWAEARRYRLGGLFNEHCTATGGLAFADAVLIPEEKAAPDLGEYRARESTAALRREVAMLRQACEERLALIQTLHTEAEKRLAIIRELQQKQSP